MLINRIRKTISALLCAIMIMSVLPSGVFAVSDSGLTDLLTRAGQLICADGTGLSRRQVKAAYDQGLAVSANTNAVSSETEKAKETLSDAIEGYKTMTDFSRVEIGGFSSWNDEVVSSFTDTKGCAVFYSSKAAAPNADFSVMVATAGSDTAYFSNASSACDIYGNSPFGVDLSGTDGIRVWVDAADLSLAETVSFSVGLRGNLASNTFVTQDIPLRKGYYTVSWSMFSPAADSLGQSPDLTGNMNFFAVSFGGVKSGFVGYVSDLHCFAESTPGYNMPEYSEEPVTTVTSLKTYKIVDRTSGLALGISADMSETQTRGDNDPYIVVIPYDAQLVMEERKESSMQEWQICLMSNGTYRIVNKATSAFLVSISSGTSYKPGLGTLLRMDDSTQTFKLAKKSGGYTISTNTTARSYLQYRYGNIAFSSASSPIWDLYECNHGEWVEVWGDEFDGEEVDRTKWRIYESAHRGDTEPVYFTSNPENVCTEDGNLVIRTKIENYNGYPVTGAYITTEGKYAVSYGKIEMRAKLPYGYWMWPALWMMGYDGGWPECGEIDIMELVGGGNEDKKVYGTLHWLSEEGKRSKGVEFYNTERLADEYHTYAAEWENDQLRIYFDGMQYMSLMLNTDTQRWGFGDNPHYLILNTSVRGPGDNRLYDNTASSSEYFIDYVRVSKRTDAVMPDETPDYCYSEQVTSIPDNDDFIWYTAGFEASPKGNYVASADSRGVVRLFNPRTGELVKRVPTGVHSNITFLKYSGSGKYLAVGTRCSEVAVYADQELNTRSFFTVPGTFVEAMEFSADDSRLYIGGKNLNDSMMPGDNRYLFIYSSASGMLLDKIRVDSDIRTISASDDGKYIAAGFTNGSVIVYNSKDCSVVNTLKCDGQIRKVGFVTGTDELFACSETGEIVRYDAVNNKTTAVMDNPAKVSVKRFAVSPDRTKIAVTTSSNFAMLFDANSGKLISLLSGFGQLTSDVAFSPDGNRLAVCSFDGTIRLYDDCGGLLDILYSNTGNKGRSINNICFTNDSSRIFAGLNYENKAVYTCKVMTETDRTPLIDAITAIDGTDLSQYTENSVNALNAARDAGSELLTKSYVSDEEIAGAVSEITRAFNHLGRLPGSGGSINGFEGWNSGDLSQMSKSKCLISLVTSASAITPNVTQSVCVNPTSTTAWDFYNYTSDGDTAGQNPFGLDLNEYTGIRFWAKGMTKEQTNGKVYIGYTGETGSFLYSATLPTITLSGLYMEIPFSDFEHVSGEETLDLSKLNTIGFSGKGAKSMFYFTELSAYSIPGEMPVITGIEDGAVYDITSADPPSAGWDIGTGYLDGSAYTQGTPVTVPGEHTLIVNNKGTEKDISFTVTDSTPYPAISGAADHGVFDLAKGEKVQPSWDTGTAELNGEAYDGTAIDAVGEYELVVTNRFKKTSVRFVVVDTSGANVPEYTPGDFDSDGQITVADALAALRIAAKLAAEDDVSIAIGDIDKDGHVTVADALAILRVAAKLVDHL